MKIPEAFRKALANKEEIVLATSTCPLLCNNKLEPLWKLEGFTLRAAFCFADNLLERNGYQLAANGEMRWTCLNP